ncbi:hypothetical protein DBR39_11310 [Chryseobacterium sp. KBW03]|jgi:hypothetical protein|uniref:hypothetical protein n=1 Tax=Chryseobacterium sp. KBW03 TaxID=2153362 RepID=UPI000F5B7251|nr:hypothetical protein [Chryseobacterium sp. KBW03]RQO39545.1 hypothetical protein DBR39_11310 [Chryseobacterium sp. KBW03]
MDTSIENVCVFLTTPSKIQRIFATPPKDGNIGRSIEYLSKPEILEGFCKLFIHKAGHLK